MRDNYDVVIVGAGSAGAVLAARLSEDAKRFVLLLEAGPDFRSADTPPEMRSPNPGRIVASPRLGKYQYPEMTARRTAVQDARPFWRGRGVGGSSAINGMFAIRGVPSDYDAWAAPGWSYLDVLPYLRRLETDLDFGDRPEHGSNGPLPIGRQPLSGWGPVDLALREAALDLEYGWCEDHNAPDGTGVSPYAMNIRSGVRVSTNDAYLEPARRRANLDICGDALVDTVTFDGPLAVGVRVRVDGAWNEVSAGEVILSAGAVHSPAILQRSGIGPAAVLDGAGVEVRAELPVGRNLQDHPLAAFVLELRPEARPTDLDARHGYCCVRYSSGLASAGTNDMMLVGMNHLLFDERQMAEGPVWGLLGAWVNQCFSRGELWITSADPNEHPTIDERMLDDERDLLRLRDATRRLLDVAGHAAVERVASGVHLSLGGPLVTDALVDDTAIDEWLLAEVGDAQHICGTCRMGPPGDQRTVVDPTCRVIGFDGLRVIDAGIMPDVPRANTHVSVVMLAERAADLLRGST